MNRNPELLAPAGSIEAFHAAYKAGADAFYMGLGDFNARRRAKNFTREELKAAILFAHRHGKKTYITMNTLLFDDEIPEAIDALTFIEDTGADGVIIQDLGLLSIAGRYFPRLAIHASTQMFCHNSRQAAFLKEQGVSRIILARELTSGEIAEIMNRVPMEYEIFIHGAMCFSFSGCCLFSSYLFGDSGNRGRCRQPCRYPCKEGGAARYPFSMLDLSTESIMGSLLSLGVRAFKIEGRLKNAEYVYKTVKRYRELIDAHAGGRELPVSRPLKTRETGSGYFHERSYRDLVSDRAPGTTGEIVGEVSSVMGTSVIIDAREPLRKGMKLRISNSEGRKVFEGTLLKFRRRGNDVYEWDTGEKITAARSLTVYRTGESAPFPGREEIFREAESVKHIPARFDITLDERRLEVRLEIPGFPPLVHIEPVEAQPAERQALSEEAVAEIFRQVDRYPFDIGSMHVSVQPDIFIPLSALKRIRRQAYHELMEEHELRVASRNKARKERILAELGDIRAAAARTGSENIFFVPAGRDDAVGDGCFAVAELEDLESAEGIGPETVIRIPLFVPEGSLPDVQARIISLIGQGYRRFMVPTYGWAGFFGSRPGVTLFGGPLLYMVNSFSYSLMRSTGVEYFTVSEDMASQAPTVAYRGYIAPRAFPKELMATRLRLPEETYRMNGRTLRVRRFRDYDVIYEDDI